MRVKEIIKQVVTATPKTTIKEAARIMSKKGIGCLVITEKKSVKGIITERDVLKEVSKGINTNSEIEKIMSKKVITITPKDSIDDAAALMSKYKIKKLPVVFEGEIVGIITATDLVANSDKFGEEWGLF